MKKTFGATLISVILISTIGFISTPNVLGEAVHRIVLPFYTSWENQQGLGRENC